MIPSQLVVFKNFSFHLKSDQRSFYVKSFFYVVETSLKLAKEAILNVLGNEKKTIFLLKCCLFHSSISNVANNFKTMAIVKDVCGERHQHCHTFSATLSFCD